MKLTAYLFYLLLLLFCHHQQCIRCCYCYVHYSMFYLTRTKIPVQVIYSFVDLDNKQQVIFTDKADDTSIACI